ncbi:MAG: ASCH domain-containing protein [Treponema sp.]|nr:ASCH domain-containing protein [Treponema sp.]
MALSQADEFWADFIKNTGRDEDDRCAGDIDFESGGIKNDAQVAMILAGKKKAIFSTFASYNADGEPLPVTGELYLLMDRSKTPRAVLELENVIVLPFNEVPWSLAQLEGEDSSLEEWKERQEEYLKDEGAIVGFTFSPDLKLICQIFNVVYR